MKIEENGVTATIFTELRKNGPFVYYKENDINIALTNTLYNVVIYDDFSQPIGMARIVGDNRIAFFIKDFVVIPEKQRQGIGTLIMHYLFNYISKHACENAYIGLMSTPGKEGFYEKFGFIRRPNEQYGAGMVLYWNKANIF
ncbi:MAG TPA: GNAT family N-acetyltransferase [Clostridia bacterium]|nr:GNAT family N-acetyltransferase [Clostridia bacterium]